VGPIKPSARGSQSQYIIVATNYLTKLVEARVLKEVDAKNTTKLMYAQFITRLGCPIEIVT